MWPAQQPHCVCGRDLGGAIGGAVVDDDDLDTDAFLAERGLERLTQEGLGLIGRDDHRHQRPVPALRVRRAHGATPSAGRL